MGLFGEYAFKEKKEKVTCLDMAKSMFSNDNKLIEEISKYLKNRKAQKNMPRVKAWECQLTLLEKVPAEQRAGQVHRATERGWMAIAFESTNTTVDTSVKRTKVNKDNIVEIGF